MMNEYVTAKCRIVKKYIDRLDLAGLPDIGAPDDEYDIETRRISERINADCDAAHIAGVIADVMREMLHTEVQTEKVMPAAEDIKAELLSTGVTAASAKLYNYCEWDRDGFSIPAELTLNENSDLADALNVFYMAGGYDFFMVNDPEYYADNWLGFMGGLYERIINGEFPDKGRAYKLPITEEQRNTLTLREVPEVFTAELR